MKKSIFLFFVPFILFAQQASQGLRREYQKSPEQVEEELVLAEAQLQTAKDMFNPWYTGPLVTPSASMLPPGEMVFQPYLTVIGNPSSFNKDRKSIKLDSTLVQFTQLVPLQVGITEHCDATVVFTGLANFQHGISNGGFQDMGITLGLCINKESRYAPNAKFTITETFPNGKFNHLNSKRFGLDATGQGSYQTTFGLAFSKLFLWTTKHPVNSRLSFSYTTPTKVHVEGFNAYGGGFGTYGTVRPGHTFKADLGLELSITQCWVVATDIVYSATNKTTFTGHSGVTAAGTPAVIGGGYSDNLSLAPAFEYNFNANLGLLAGIWFSVYGRNSLDFVAGQVSVCWVYP